MGLLDLFKRKESIIDFSDNNVTELTKLIDYMGDTLVKSGNGFYVDHLSQVRLAAERQDNDKFKQLVISRELFGGAGAMWEIWIENEELRNKYTQQFSSFIDHLKKMGIKNGRVNQIKSTIKKFK